jgi:hypothetical protein
MTDNLSIFFGCLFWSIDFESKFALALSLCVKNSERFRICEIVFEGQSKGYTKIWGLKNTLQQKIV